MLFYELRALGVGGLLLSLISEPEHFLHLKGTKWGQKMTYSFSSILLGRMADNLREACAVRDAYSYVQIHSITLIRNLLIPFGILFHCSSLNFLIRLCLSGETSSA